MWRKTMPAPRPFRFGAVADAMPSHTAWLEVARKVEAMGYATLLQGDHPSLGGIAPLTALMAAADATTTVRLGTHVLANDFRHPVMLAQEASTFDVLSDERFELGLGTGWSRDDYAALGISLDAPATRVARLEEAVTLI